MERSETRSVIVRCMSVAVPSSQTVNCSFIWLASLGWSSIGLGWYVVEIRGVPGPTFVWKAVFNSADVLLKFAVYLARCFYENQYLTRPTCHWDSRCAWPDVFKEISILLGRHVIQIRGVPARCFYEKQYLARLTCYWNSRCTWPDVFMKSSI
jgi:hypothetical protein